MRRNQTNRERPSRFNPREANSYNATSSQLQMPTHYPARNNYQLNAPVSTSTLTPEQAAFELEFKKWEKSFDDWKNAYANHPDRTAYKQYEKKFLDVREKLIAKRAQIYKQNVPLELQLDLQLSAASQMAESILQKFSEPPSYIETPLNPMNIQRTSMANFNDFNSNSRDGGGFNNMLNRSRSPYLNRSPPRNPYQMEPRNSSFQMDQRNNFYQMQPGIRSFQRPSIANNFQMEPINNTYQMESKRNFQGKQRQNLSNRSRSPINRNHNRSKNKPKESAPKGPAQPKDLALFQSDPNSKRTKKRQEQMIRQLARTDVYPNVPWYIS